MERVGQRVAMFDIELVVIDVVQEHIDPAEVVGGDIDFLAKEALAHVLLAQYFSGL